MEKKRNWLRNGKRFHSGIYKLIYCRKNIVRLRRFYEKLERPTFSFLSFVVKPTYIYKELARSIFYFRRKAHVHLRGISKACVFFYDDLTTISVYEYFTMELFSIYKKKTEGRHLHKNSWYQFKIAFETDQNCSGDSSLPSGFLKLLFSFFLCKLRMGS